MNFILSFSSLFLVICIQFASSQNSMQVGEHDLITKINGGYTHSMGYTMYMTNGKQEGEKVVRFNALYDSQGNLIDYNDADGFSTSFTYDLSGTLIKSTENYNNNPNKKTTRSFIYNDKQQFVKQIEMLADSSITTSVHNYDSIGKRLSTVTHFFFGKDDTLYYAYDKTGQLSVDSNRSTWRKHVFDSRGNEIEITSKSSCGTVSLYSDYLYDSNNNVQKLTKRYVERNTDTELMKVEILYDNYGNRRLEDRIMGKIKGLEDIEGLGSGYIRTEYVYSK